MSDVQHEGDTVLHQDAIEAVVDQRIDDQLLSNGVSVQVLGPFTVAGDDSVLGTTGVALWTPEVGDVVTLMYVFPVDSPDWTWAVGPAQAGELAEWQEANTDGAPSDGVGYRSGSVEPINAYTDVSVEWRVWLAGSSETPTQGSYKFYVLVIPAVA